MKGKREMKEVKEEKKMTKQEEYFMFLDFLRETGSTNMYFSAPYLLEAYPELSEKEAKEIVYSWIKSHEEE